MSFVVVHVVAAASFSLAHVAFAPRHLRGTIFVFSFVGVEPTTHVIARAIEPATVIAIVIVVAAIVPRVLAAHRISVAVVALTMIAVLFAADRLGTTPLDLGASRPLLELRLLEASNPVLVAPSVPTLAIVAWH
jgi:hypothetical protein